MPISKISAARGGIPGFPTSYWSALGVALYLGDVRACLRRLPTRSVHCAVTSPPYWGLRDYGTGTWEGGSAECDHMQSVENRGLKSTLKNDGRPQDQVGWNVADRGAHKTQYKNVCAKCGAVRVDNQIGLEEIPDCLGWATGTPCGECFVCVMVEVFSEVRRVLRDDGTLWLNLGDKFDDGQLLVPSRVALALVADGWRLVQDIIWYAPNKMPESVTNRCSKSHEHIFLLAKGPGYYYDAVAIAEESKTAGKPGGFTTGPADAIGRKYSGSQLPENQNKPRGAEANKRDVWVVPTQGYPGAHYATFSPRLITPCILAGTSDHGCCAACGRPWERVVSKRIINPDERPESDDVRDHSLRRNRNGIGSTFMRPKRKGGGSHFGRAVPPENWKDGMSGQHQDYQDPAPRETVGWRRCCGCQTDEVVQAVVLDPFSGSGTTVATSLDLGRRGVGIDLSEKYILENAVPRIEAALRGEKVSRKPTVAVPPDAPPPPSVLR